MHNLAFHHKQRPWARLLFKRELYVIHHTQKRECFCLRSKTFKQSTVSDLVFFKQQYKLLQISIWQECSNPSISTSTAFLAWFLLFWAKMTPLLSWGSLLPVFCNFCTVWFLAVKNFFGVTFDLFWLYFFQFFSIFGPFLAWFLLFWAKNGQKWPLF